MSLSILVNILKQKVEVAGHQSVRNACFGYGMDSRT